MDTRMGKEDYYLDIADAVLNRSTCMRRKYGAIIVRNDEILSTGVANAAKVNFEATQEVRVAVLAFSSTT